MLEMQGQNQEDGDDGYEGEDYPQVWETWGKAGGNALGNFVEELLEQEGVTEADAQEWIDCIGYDMPEEVWRIIKETEQGSKKVNFSKQTVKEILEQLNINPETVLVVRNKEVITEDDPLNDQDTLEILNVVSGG